MAASNPPKHDFAPHWLKIPTPNENARPSGPRSLLSQDHGRQRHDDGYYSRYNGNGRDYPRPLNRQNSFDVSDGGRHFHPGHAGKLRHHSMEEGYVNGSYYGHPLGYNDFPAMQFRSQPSLPPRQELKHSSSRFAQVNGGYNGNNGSFCDFYPLGEGFSSYGGGGHSKRSLFARDGRANSRESRDSDRSTKDGDDKDKSFNDDFPSLNGTDEVGDVKLSRNTSSGGVWDNPPRSKFEESADTKNSSGSSLYKVVPAKVGSTPVRKNSRDGIRVNGNTREGSPLAAIKPRASRDAQQGSPTHSLEKLSTRLVRPKPVDKKSEFLKALRKEADNADSAMVHNGVDMHTDSSSGLYNGSVDHHIHDSTMHNGVSNTSMKGEKEAQEVAMTNGVVELQPERQCPRRLSLNGTIHLQSPVRQGPITLKRQFTEEEEKTFLLSMGWDESAETEEITEDEKREFQKKRLLRQQQRQERSFGQTPQSPEVITPTSPFTPQPTARDMDQGLPSSDTA